MKDVTRGPSMHNEQFEGLTWASVPLFDQVHVWLLGASDAASEAAALADHVGFAVTVVDYDPAYVSEARFPTAKRIVLEGGNFDALEQLDAAPEDYVCVLTRGHMFDPEGCVWATRHHVHYVGMMGCAGKNDRVRELVLASGATEEDWERVKRPIGLKFGATRLLSWPSPSSPSSWTCATANATAPKRANATRRAWAAEGVRLAAGLADLFVVRVCGICARFLVDLAVRVVPCVAGDWTQGAVQSQTRGKDVRPYEQS